MGHQMASSDTGGLFEVYLDGYTLDPLTQVNRSNLDALVKFPGFGFWPLWYWETFRNLTISRNETEKYLSPASDVSQRNKARFCACEAAKH